MLNIVAEWIDSAKNYLWMLTHIAKMIKVSTREPSFSSSMANIMFNRIDTRLSHIRVLLKIALAVELDTISEKGDVLLDLTFLGLTAPQSLLY